MKTAALINHEERTICTLPEGGRISPYDTRYYEQVKTLVTGIQSDELGSGITFEEQYDLQDIPGTYLKGKGNFWLALQGNEVIGTIGFIDLGSHMGSLKKMFVKSAYRGKAKAVAHNLLACLLLWAGENGFKHIYLGTGPTLHAAHRFYEKHGFELLDDKAIPRAVLDTLVRVDTRRYYKAI